MARASNVYILKVGAEIVGGFTVKYEAENWRTRHCPEAVMYRLADGYRKTPEQKLPVIMEASKCRAS